MLTFLTNAAPFKRKIIWFAEEPSLRDGLFNSYLQSFSKKAKFGFKRIPKYTKIIEISNDDIESCFCKQTRKKIKRAQEHGIVCKTLSDNTGFINMYNEFSINKHFHKRLQEKDLLIFGKSHITRAACSSEGRFLVYHTYLMDESLKRVRLFYSVSVIHGEISQEERNLTGYANRYLHYQDMLLFKEMQYKTYDFGGYAYNTTDKSLMGINEFKDGFGGQLIEESNYESIISYLFIKAGVGKIVKKLIH